MLNNPRLNKNKFFVPRRDKCEESQVLSVTFTSLHCLRDRDLGTNRSNLLLFFKLDLNTAYCDFFNICRCRSYGLP